MSALVVDAVVDQGRIRVLDEYAYRLLAERRAKTWGDGTALKVRVEPEEEAWRHSDVKFLFGHVYMPVVQHEETGYTKTELHLASKALWMPDGKVSLVDLDRPEMREYISLSKKWLLEEMPLAFQAHERYCEMCRNAA